MLKIEFEFEVEFEAMAQQELALLTSDNIADLRKFDTIKSLHGAITRHKDNYGLLLDEIGGDICRKDLEEHVRLSVEACLQMYSIASEKIKARVWARKIRIAQLQALLPMTLAESRMGSFSRSWASALTP